MADCFIRFKEVKRRTSLARSTIYLLISRDEFPKPVSLGGRSVAWKESEIEAWRSARPLAEDGAVARRPPGWYRTRIAQKMGAAPEASDGQARK
jgi:prophage regulatory protein